MWQDSDSKLDLMLGVPISGRSIRKWRLHMLAQEAALEEIANGEMRRLLARN